MVPFKYGFNQVHAGGSNDRPEKRCHISTWAFSSRVRSRTRKTRCHRSGRLSWATGVVSASAGPTVPWPGTDRLPALRWLATSGFVQRAECGHKSRGPTRCPGIIAGPSTSAMQGQRLLESLKGFAIITIRIGKHSSVPWSTRWHRTVALVAGRPWTGRPRGRPPPHSAQIVSGTTHSPSP
jgi:hypothetical protein